ncbi:MAG: gamma-glutamylcyclotransferase [Flavobacteriaceae bacterium]|nr:MAG: gamma-glutamylcyclotransferase [Flavobacteriaceae bacterium]
MENLFVYGTLLDPKVRRRIFGISLDGCWDALPGYKKEEGIVAGTYPGIMPSDPERSEVAGLLFSLPSEILARVDTYEGSLYYRKTLNLRSGKSAWVYLPAENQIR